MGEGIGQLMDNAYNLPPAIVRLLDGLCEIRSREIVRDDIATAFEFADVKNGDNRRMPELGHTPGFSKERFVLDPRGEIPRNLDGDFAPELGIKSQINFSESTRTEQSLD
jgi:hypothetical protein